jgi:thioredoxin-like negative regulator of GroEL
VALFYSDYCPTCEDVLDAWKEFVELHRGEGLFIRIKKDRETQRMFKELGVSWVPTVVFYFEDKEVKRVEGFFTLSDLERALRRTLSKVAVRA